MRRGWRASREYAPRTPAQPHDVRAAGTAAGVVRPGRRSPPSSARWTGSGSRRPPPTRWACAWCGWHPWPMHARGHARLPRRRRGPGRRGQARLRRAQVRDALYGAAHAPADRRQAGRAGARSSRSRPAPPTRTRSSGAAGRALPDAAALRRRGSAPARRRCRSLARRSSAPAARTTCRRGPSRAARRSGDRLPRARRDGPAGTAAGCSARRRWAARARSGSAWRRSPATSTTSRTWATGRSTTRARWRSARAVAAGVNMTFKLLYNDAIAMTGGQRAPGRIAVVELVHWLELEGVRRVIVTRRGPDALRGRRSRRSRRVRHRDELPGAAQAELAAERGRDRADPRPTAARPRSAGCASAAGCPSPHAARVDQRARVRGLRRLRREVELPLGGAGRDRVRPQDADPPVVVHQDFACLKGDCPSFLEVDRPREAVVARRSTRDRRSR